MRSERMTSLARYVISLSSSPANTAAEQWFERTLDDSANKRLSIPEAFLAADAILIIGLNVLSGLIVYPQVIARHVAEELPFMATENILMAAVKKGGDRQALHERIRTYSMEAQKNIKTLGKPNDLLERIVGDPAFKLKKMTLTGSWTFPRLSAGRRSRWKSLLRNMSILCSNEPRNTAQLTRKS
jgi:adenylosuccinate lyase